MLGASHFPIFLVVIAPEPTNNSSVTIQTVFAGRAISDPIIIIHYQFDIGPTYF